MTSKIPNTLFKKVQEKIDTKSGILSPVDSRDGIEDLVQKINVAIENKDSDALPWLQIEVQARTLIMLRMIDWKLWEFHSKISD